MPRNNSKKKKQNRGKKGPPWKGPELALKVQEILGDTAVSTSDRAKLLLTVHAKNGGQNFQAVLRAGWALQNSAISAAADAAIVHVLENASDPQSWKYPFTNWVVIVFKSIPTHSQAPRTIEWIHRNYERLSLTTKALVFEQRLCDYSRSNESEGGAELPASAGGSLRAVMQDLLSLALRKPDYRAASAIIVAGLLRCPPISELPVDQIEAVIVGAIGADQSSHLRIFGEKRLLEASKCSADLKAFVEQQQIRIVDKLVGRHDSKSAFKLFRHFEVQESDCPGLRGLCEEKSLSWHVSAGHYDILEGRLERRPELVPIIQNLWKRKHAGESLENFLAAQLQRTPRSFQSRAGLIDGLRCMVDREWELAQQVDAAADSTPPYQRRCKTVEMVDSIDGVRNMVDHILLESEGLFAFDCEWTPTLSNFDKQYCAILTIATRQRGFLVDCVKLRPIQSKIPFEGGKSVAQLLDTVFGSDTIHNIGYSSDGDRRALRVTFPDAKSFTRNHRHIDVSHGNYLRALVAKFGHGQHQPLPEGLASLVKAVLQVRLPKGSQISDWERRPLRPAQFGYAINDADCLIALWDAGELGNMIKGGSSAKKRHSAK
mmetsp:Transcript_17846/g.26189  ORF Transcript_17846/g.26189 Transcript_17846/m.26189 type:complete len:602 (+) Transcript_17846:185-1990(+)